MYVLAGSELEINIETAMRKKVLQVRDAASLFSNLFLACFDVFFDVLSVYLWWGPLAQNEMVPFS